MGEVFRLVGDFLGFFTGSGAEVVGGLADGRSLGEAGLGIERTGAGGESV